MKWHVLAAVLLAILVPLPLVWLFSTALFGQGVTPQRTQPLNVIPMLTPEERQSVLTYGRNCRTDEDCDSRLRCFFSMVTQDSYCVDSRCISDRQCQDGFTCQSYTARNGKDLINACSLVGERKEGESCEPFTREREQGCESGLLCHFRCGRPCQVDNPASCPEGFFCEDDPAGPACQPTCEGRTCPEGQVCVSVAGRVSICAQVHGQDCQRSPCAQGQVCSVFDPVQPADEVWMSCRQPCGREDDPPCPEGTICHLYQCRQSCSPDDVSACGPGFTCKRRLDEPWMCAPDLPAGSEE